MSFASPADRLALRNSVEASGFVLDFVVQVRKEGRESEFAADDLDHALTISGQWLNVHKAEYVEVFRVNSDGTLRATLGAN